MLTLQSLPVSRRRGWAYCQRQADPIAPESRRQGCHDDDSRGSDATDDCRSETLSSEEDAQTSTIHIDCHCCRRHRRRCRRRCCRCCYDLCRQAIDVHDVHHGTPADHDASNGWRMPPRMKRQSPTRRRTTRE